MVQPTFVCPVRPATTKALAPLKPVTHALQADCLLTTSGCHVASEIVGKVGQEFKALPFDLEIAFALVTLFKWQSLPRWCVLDEE